MQGMRISDEAPLIRDCRTTDSLYMYIRVPSRQLRAYPFERVCADRSEGREGLRQGVGGKRAVWKFVLLGVAVWTGSRRMLTQGHIVLVGS